MPFITKYSAKNIVLRYLKEGEAAKILGIDLGTHSVGIALSCEKARKASVERIIISSYVKSPKTHRKNNF